MITAPFCLLFGFNKGALNLGAEYPSPKKVNLLFYSRII